MKSKLFLLLVVILATVSMHAQDKIAVLPFTNLDGKEEINEFCQMFQDSLIAHFKAGDPDELNYTIISADIIAKELDAIGTYPTKPSYQDDLWGVIEKLGCQRAVMGELMMNGKKIVVNVSVYDVELRLPMPKHQIRNLFAPPERMSSLYPRIAKKLRQGILGN